MLREVLCAVAEASAVNVVEVVLLTTLISKACKKAKTPKESCLKRVAAFKKQKELDKD